MPQQVQLADPSPFVPVLNMQSLQLDETKFVRLCHDNPDLQLELTHNGELIIMPPTSLESGWRNSDLNFQVTAWARADGSGIVFDSSTMFTLPSGAKRSPDVSWLRRERWENLSPEERQRFSRIAPDFVIELRSPTDSLPDLQAKMEEYITNGVRLGWLIDPQTRRVHIYVPQRETVILDDPESVSGADILPGFTLDVREIW